MWRKSRISFVVLLIGVLGACSLTEPSYTLQPSVRDSNNYETEREKAEKVIADLQERKSRMLIEKDVYAWTAIASGLAAVIGGIYGLDEDAITGIALGGATAVGVSAFQNPTAVAASYGDGIDAINCAMNQTDQIKNLRPSSFGVGNTQALTSRLNAAAKDLTAFGEEYNPMDFIQSNTNNATEVAFGYALLNHENTVNIAAKALSGVSNFINEPKNNPANLLHGAVTDIILKMNKQIESRERDKSKLEPTAITEAAKGIKDKKKDSQNALKFASQGFDTQVVPVMIALSAIQPNTLINGKPMAQVMIDLRNKIGQFSEAAEILEDIDLSKLDFDICLKELQ